MKKLITALTFVIVATFSINAQDAKTITLEQTKGEFTQKQVTLSEGDYVFNIANHNVGTEIGFVIIPEGADASDPKNHIKESYVTKTVPDGETGHTGTVSLKKGTYEYFCPLNKTPQYTLIVE